MSLKKRFDRCILYEKALMKITNNWFWNGPSIYRQLPKNQLRAFEAFNHYGRLPKLFLPATGGQNLSWLAIDLLILSFGNSLDVRFLSNEEFIKEALAYWKEHLAVVPMLTFTEIIWPNRVTEAIAVCACKKLLESEFFIQHFFPMLRRELKIGFIDRRRYSHLDLAPIEKSRASMFINNYIRNKKTCHGRKHL
jgi:hypothetical protein